MCMHIYTPDLPINKNKITVEFIYLQRAYVEQVIIEMQIG